MYCACVCACVPECESVDTRNGDKLEEIKTVGTSEDREGGREVGEGGEGGRGGRGGREGRESSANCASVNQTQ